MDAMETKTKRIKHLQGEVERLSSKLSEIRYESKGDEAPEGHAPPGDGLVDVKTAISVYQAELKELGAS